LQIQIIFTLLTTLPPLSVSFTDSCLFPHGEYYYKIAIEGIGGTSPFSTIAYNTPQNYMPVINKISLRSLRYDTVTTLLFKATDADGDSIAFSVLQKPAFAVFTTNGNNTASLTFTPSASNIGFNKKNECSSKRFAWRKKTRPLSPLP